MATATVVEAALIPAVIETKTVIRCKKCQLNQYMTRDGDCRRCHHALLFEEPPAVVERAPQAQKTACTRPSVDMATAIWMLRSARGLSQRQMAKKMGIARTYISKLESNRCQPSPSQIARIAGTLEVSEYCLVALATVHNQLPARPAEKVLTQ